MSVRNVGRVYATSEMWVTVLFVRPICKEDETTENTQAVWECLSEGITLQYNSRHARDGSKSIVNVNCDGSIAFFSGSWHNCRTSVQSPRGTWEELRKQEQEWMLRAQWGWIKRKLKELSICSLAKHRIKGQGKRLLLWVVSHPLVQYMKIHISFITWMQKREIQNECQTNILPEIMFYKTKIVSKQTWKTLQIRLDKSLRKYREINCFTRNIDWTFLKDLLSLFSKTSTEIKL